MARRNPSSNPIPIRQLVEKIRKSQGYLEKGMIEREKLENMRTNLNTLRRTGHYFEIDRKELIEHGLGSFLPKRRQIYRPTDGTKRIRISPERIPFLLNIVSEQIDYREKGIHIDRRDIHQWTYEYRERMPLLHRVTRFVKKTKKRTIQQNTQRAIHTLRKIARRK